MTEEPRSAEGLKPCPFCNAAPIVDTAQLVRNVYYWVACRNQECRVLPSGMQCLNRSQAIEAWNTRPTTDTVERETTLSPESQAVLVAVTRWYSARDDGGDCKYLEPFAADVAIATRAYRATLSPKDYAPDELEPGQRFRFVSDNRGAAQREMVFTKVTVNAAEGGGDWHGWLTDEFRIASFAGNDRLIPLDQDE